MDEKKELILQIADYIIENKSSYNKTALKFKLSKSTIGKYMTEYLPKINPKKALEVREITDSNSDKITIEDILRIEQEYILYISGYTFKEISELTDRSYSIIQRDLSNRLEKIDRDKANEVKKITYENKKTNTINRENLIKRMDLEYNLLLKGYNLKQISLLVNSSYSSVQRDLDLLKALDKEKNTTISQILNNNQTETQIKRR